MGGNGEHGLMSLPGEVRNRVYGMLSSLHSRDIIEADSGRLFYDLNNPIFPLAATNSQIRTEVKPFVTAGEDEPIIEVRYKGDRRCSPKYFGPSVFDAEMYAPEAGPPVKHLRRAAKVEIRCNGDDHIDVCVYFTFPVFRAYVHHLAVQQMRHPPSGVVKDWPEDSYDWFQYRASVTFAPGKSIWLGGSRVIPGAPGKPIPPTWEHAILDTMDDLVHPANRIEVSGVQTHLAMADALITACQHRFQGNPKRWLHHVLLMGEQVAKRLRGLDKHDPRALLRCNREPVNKFVFLAIALHSASRLLEACPSNVQAELTPEHDDLMNQYFAAVVRAPPRVPITTFCWHLYRDIHDGPPAWLDSVDKWLVAQHIHLVYEHATPKSKEAAYALRDDLFLLVRERDRLNLRASRGLFEDMNSINNAIDTDNWDGLRNSFVHHMRHEGMYPWIKVVEGEDQPRTAYKRLRNRGPEEKHWGPRWDYEGTNKVRKRDMGAFPRL